MPLPLLAAAGALGGASLIKSGIDIYGGNKAARAQRKAQGKARTDLSQGYSDAQGFQQPIYDTGVKNYTDLSAKYAGGGFDNPKMDAYKFDPQGVFQDPEYQASLRAGTDAINGGANANSMLFSGQNQRDLSQFGQDTFAKRSDALYKRGFDATNTAFDQNAKSNLTNFNMGIDLAQPGIGAADNLSTLAQGQGQDLANNSLGTGQIRAGNINNTSNALGKGLTDLTNIGAMTAANWNNPNIFQPKAGRK
jgi:hypothetical protein